ncbi:Fur-regulated basic protein FbpA [Neobacillus mesonae]|uniref:Fur-regulated basic protein FbpA n=1 Tax=Neobacillus mesonae TaxID=1193713 RepID=UPI00203CAECC|nr:Fur-regulated basic protein FbpA [Neobacillus mesonae]MCM3570863.1 Fur-regulated basic protein FbpA [Neobacillus mesonae]
MKDFLQDAVQRERQILIEKLIKSGVFKIKNKHLYEGSLSELKDLYKEIRDYEAVTS